MCVIPPQELPDSSAETEEDHELQLSRVSDPGWGVSDGGATLERIVSTESFPREGSEC